MKADRPNILFILTDDQGWGDLKSFGHPYLKTPNLDRLAAEGVSLTNFYVTSPVCSPSRVSFMTGHYPARHNVHHIYRMEHQRDRMISDGVPPYLDPRTPLLTRTLQEAGYAVGHFGKWHLGQVPETPAISEYGIDDSRAFGTKPSEHGWPDWQQEEHWRGKSTDLFVDETIRFIDANRDRPFYVNLWTLIPHAVLDPTPEQLAEYEGLHVDPNDFEGWMREYVEQAEDLDSKMQVYCASMTSLDRAVGRLLDHLEQTGLADNTLVLYTSDNGPEDYCVGNASNAGVGSPGPCRARKRSIYDGGVRVPAIARWPGRIPAGRVDDESIVSAVDWLPTVCAAAGVEIPDITPDGEDVRDILAGTPRQRRSPLFWEWKCNLFGDERYRPPQLAMREGRWKLFMNPDGSELALYDLHEDPGEYTNVADQHPDVVDRLKPQLAAWKATLPERHPYETAKEQA